MIDRPKTSAYNIHGQFQSSEVLMPDFVLDWEQGRRVVDTVLKAYKQDAYPYQGRVLPQDLIPAQIRRDPLQTARLLFYSCHYMRGTIKSDYAIRALCTLYLHRPELFDPQTAKDLAFEDVQGQLGSVLPYKLGEVPRLWIENSVRLVEHWGGDPRAIFAEIQSSEDLYRFVTNTETTHGVKRSEHPRERGFLGFQRKMASMLTYFLEDFELIEKVKWPPSPPVDFHLLRLLIANGVIVILNKGRRHARYEELQNFGIELLEVYIRETGETMRDVANALWMLSNRLCNEAPTNDTRDGKLVEVDWSLGSNLSKYATTCGACPLEASCSYAIQANTYYHQGKFELHQPRSKPLTTSGNDSLFVHGPLIYRPDQSTFVPVQLKALSEQPLFKIDLPRTKTKTRDQTRRERMEKALAALKKP